MFNIGDVIIGRGRNVYRITNSDNLCIVTMTREDRVVLREACEKVLGVPKDAVGEIVSFINEDDIIDRFGEIVVAFPSLKKYEIIRKNYIKHLTTL